MDQFIEFIETKEGEGKCDEELRSRIFVADAGGQIASLNDLIEFARERYPEEYSSDPRKSLDGPRGLTAMKKLWAAYLHWGELTSARSDKAMKE
jgi:hypothetical protein